MFRWPFRRSGLVLPEGIAARVREWERLPAPSEAVPIEAARFVVVDTETTGPDPARAGLLSVGACEVERGSARLGNAFEVRLRPRDVSHVENVLIHHIGQGAQRAAEPAADGLVDWLAFCGRPVFVGFHAGFDALVLGRHVRECLGARLPDAWLDVRILLCGLFPGPTRSTLDLDGWLEAFGITLSARHSAAADALATAQLLLIALQQASRQELRTVRHLRQLHDKTLRTLATRSGETAGL